VVPKNHSTHLRKNKFQIPRDFEVEAMTWDEWSLTCKVLHHDLLI